VTTPSISVRADVLYRGLHNDNSSFRLRLFYLFYRFIRECRNDISPDFCSNIAESFRDLLQIDVQLPDPEEVEGDYLTESVRSSTFESQLYLYETIGILCSVMFKNPSQETSLLLSFVKPLMDDLSQSLMNYSNRGNQDIMPIVRTHHIIMALGNIAKGFPDYPSPVPPNYSAPQLAVFTEVAQAILVCLQAMNIYRVVRDAVRNIFHHPCLVEKLMSPASQSRFAFSRLLASAGPAVTSLVPSLMSNLLAHFESTELVDFLNFIGLLIFKLPVSHYSTCNQDYL
jgi:exportin-T